MSSPDRERFGRLERLLDEALALTPAQRTAWLDTCAEAPALRAELAALLALDATGGPLDRAPHALVAAALDASSASGQGARVLGRYHLQALLGEGGMATVWAAQAEIAGAARTVAVKCLKTGLATPELRARFLREQQILARLEHPAIARLYDAGISDDGVPYLVMERVEGEPIGAYCDHHRLGVGQRLRLFRQVLDAVACAHQNLIVHRDLKPANILVTADGRPKLLDFGIAKLLADDDEATRTHWRALTPAYAAPEQFTSAPATTATDVYALGVLLHVLLAGAKPQRAADDAASVPLASQALQRCLAVHPVEADAIAACRGYDHARRLVQALRGDLDTLIATAMHADPARRYRDAAALDADIERYLEQRPLRARRDRFGYRARKFLRRNWLATSALAGVVLALAAGVVLASWQARRANIEAGRAAAALADTEHALRRAGSLHDFLIDLFRGADPDRPADRLPSTQELLAQGARRALSAESAPAEERVGILLTIGQIYYRQSQNEQARELLDTAVALARQFRDERPDDLARALHERALVARRLGDQEGDRAMLMEAEALVAGQNRYWNTFAMARTSLAWHERLRGNHRHALDLLAPVHEQMRERDDVDERIRLRLLDILASIQRSVGNLEAAAALRAEATDLTRRLDGTDSREYAVMLAFSAFIEHDLGRFDAAEARARDAIALFDRILDGPVDYRASARRSLARTLLATGRVDEALAQLELSSAEWAQTMGKPVDALEAHFLHRGEFLARAHRWPQAERDLRRAADLLERIQRPHRDAAAAIHALWANALCHLDRTQDGWTALAALEQATQGRPPDNPSSLAQVGEAQAACARSTRPAQALDYIDQALAAERHPGRVLELGERRLLRARILVALDRADEALGELDHAERLYRDLGLAHHPNLPAIIAARDELAIGSVR